MVLLASFKKEYARVLAEDLREKVQEVAAEKPVACADLYAKG